LALERERTLVLNFINAHLYNMAIRVAGFRGYLERSDIITADGMSIVWAARLLGYSMEQRCNMTEAFRAFLEDRDMPESQSVLVGADEENMIRAKNSINKASSHCCLVDCISGFKGDEAYRRFFQRHAGVDMVFLGMGSPKSERIAEIAASVCSHAIVWHIGGGTIMFYAGALVEAPVWMRRLGLQWLHRLWIEPRRMWKRYLIGNPLFVWHVLRARLATAKQLFSF
jgi:exopolysaccharide biosynthesis WecB/TagA/CpsF family protein